jgi:hypothetical protein
MALQPRFGLLVVVLSVVSSAWLCQAEAAQQSSPPTPAAQPPSAQPPTSPAASSPPALPAPANSDAGQPAVQPPTGCISGSVIDQSGAVVAGAVVKVAIAGQPVTQQATTGNNGQFFIANIVPGPFQLMVSSSGFAPRTLAGNLHAGEIDSVPPIVLSVASSVTEVQVGLTQQEVAQEQIKIEEKQRVLGVIPNFYVSYVPDAAPLSPKQKFQLAARTVIDPFTLVVVAGTAGVEQWQNHFIGYGQGLQGYAKRFGANYADTLTGTFIGGAILPSILKQDPRYFYKGTGSFHSRFLYAIGMVLICKGDNRRWQPNYSNVLGSLAAGGISNLYYPSQDRSSASLTFENAGVGLIASAAGNILQEFIIPKLTPNHHPRQAQQ